MLQYRNLVNSLLRRHGEAEISSANFASPTASIHKLAKDAIRLSVNKIHNSIDELPFTATTGVITCSTGVSIYSVNSTAKALDWDSFFLLEDSGVTGASARPLDDMDWDEYNEYYKSQDNQTSSAVSYGSPERVVRTHQNKVLIYPKPDDVYSISYIYYTLPVTLAAATDAVTIPDRFEELILDGGTYHLSRKRGNPEEVSELKREFLDGIKTMKIQLQHDRVSTMRDTRTPRARKGLIAGSYYGR